MKKSIIILFISLCSFIYAEDNNNERLTLDLSYYGVLGTHPGLKTGIEFPITEKNREKLKKEKIRVSTSKLYIAPNIGLYHHKRFHNAFFTELEIGYRKTFYSGFGLELSSGLGYTRSFLSGKTYEVSDSGEVDTVLFAGSSYFTPSLSLKLNKKTKNSLYYIGSRVLFTMPYNTGEYPVPNLVFEFGIKKDNFFKNPFYKSEKQKEVDTDE